MKLSTMFIIYAAISAIFGLAFVFVPETSLALYGITLSPGGILIARLFGAALLEFALLSWLASTTTVFYKMALLADNGGNTKPLEGQ